MFERFTDRARKVMALANQEAQRFNHEYIGTEHILLGLVKEGSGVGANVLKNLEIDMCKVRLEVEKFVKSGPETVTMGRLPQTPRSKNVIQYAIEEARNLNHNYVGTEHLLLGLCRETEGVASKILNSLRLSVEDIRTETIHLLGSEKVSLNVPSEVISQLQQLAEATVPEVVAPFSFRFIDYDQRYELLDSSGQVVDSKVFGGIVGAYVYNALRKHESIQKLLRDCQEMIKKELSIDPPSLGIRKMDDFVALNRRIDQQLD